MFGGYPHCDLLKKIYDQSKQNLINNNIIICDIPRLVITIHNDVHQAQRRLHCGEYSSKS